MSPYKDLGHICHPPDSEYDPVNKRWHKQKEPSALPYTIAAIAAFILLITIVRLL